MKYLNSPYLAALSLAAFLWLAAYSYGEANKPYGNLGAFVDSHQGKMNEAEVNAVIKDMWGQ